MGQWNTEKQKIELTTVNLPTSCVVDFTEGYTITLGVTNGTTEPVSKIVGREGKAEFTITPNVGYINEILTDSCNGTFSDNKYIIEDITSSKTCNLTLTSEEYTLALNVTNGTSDSTSVKVRNGEEAIFNLTPSTGYTTKEATITCDGSASGNISNNVLTFTSIDSNQTCSVNITKSEWNKYNLKTKLIYIWNKYNVVTSPSISYSTTSGTFVTNTVWSLSGTTPENSVSGSTFDRSSAWACSNVGTGWYTYGGDTVAYYITSCLAAQKKFSYSKTATISSGSSYSKGSTSYGTVTSTSSGTYPTNGKSGSYWYVSAGSTSQTLDEPGTLSGTIVADYGTYPENGKSENYWYIRK